VLSEAVASGALAVVGLVYALDDGRVSVVEVLGGIDTAAGVAG
jgi:carbonic anhydrase